MTFSTIDPDTRKRLGQECEQLLLQLEYVLDSINEGLVVCDLEGNVLAMNKLALALHGFGKNEQARQPLSVYREMFDMFDLAGNLLRFEAWPFMRAIEGERFDDYEVQVRREKSGATWVGSYSGAPVQNKRAETILTVLTVRDITEKKRTEEALSTVRGNLRLISNTMPVRVIRCNQDRQYLWVSEEYARWLRRPPEEIIGHSMPEIIGKEAYQTIAPFVDRVLAGERVTFEILLDYAGLGPRWITATYMPTYDVAGTPDGWFGVVFDITDKKDLEAELRQTNEELEKRIEQTVEELRQKDQLLVIQGRQAVMGEMISNIAHQWRQPLNSIGLFAQELLMICRRGELSPEYIESNVGNSLKSIRYLSKTIDDFRFFFKPDAEKQPFRAHEVLERTLSLLEASLAEQNIETRIERHGDPVVNGYPNQFSQVLLNIMNNARDAFTERSVQNPLIVIRVSTEGGRTVVTLSDNAGGIPDQVIEKVFAPYFSTKGSGQGCGIGLFMCKTIIENNMNGVISVRNVGAGAEFRIEL